MCWVGGGGGHVFFLIKATGNARSPKVTGVVYRQTKVSSLEFEPHSAFRPQKTPRGVQWAEIAVLIGPRMGVNIRSVEFSILDLRRADSNCRDVTTMRR